MASPSGGGGKVLLGIAAAFPLIPYMIVGLAVMVMLSGSVNRDQLLKQLGGSESGGRGGYVGNGGGEYAKLIGALTWRKQAVQIGSELDVDPNLILAIMAQESGGDQYAESGVGALGLMQLMPDTAAGLHVDPRDALQSIRGGASYIKQMLAEQNGDLTLALAAYNAGPSNVKEYGGVPPWPETEKYVVGVSYYYDVLKNNRSTVNPGDPKRYGPVLYDGYPSVEPNDPGGTCLPGTKPPLPAPGWQNPVPGQPPSDRYGIRRSPMDNVIKCHFGADIAAPPGTSVYPAADAKVVGTVYSANYGNLLILDHGNEVYTWYAHLSAINVRPGEIVRKDQVVAATGNTGAWTTGPHLHFEVHAMTVKDGSPKMVTEDPEDYIGPLD